jgi:hypothetical protein
MSVLSEIIDAPIGPRGITISSYVGRKATRGAVKEVIGRGTAEAIDEDKKAADHPALEKLIFMGELAKMSALYKEAPFKSESQRRKFYAMKSRGEISGKEVRKWESGTPKGKKLPERLHRKSAEEKNAILGAIARTALKGGKAMLMPTTRLQSAAGNALWAGFAATSGAIAGAKAPTPTGIQGRMRMAETVDRLVELTKQGIEFHSHGPASTDAAEPDVKKNGGKIAQESASSSSVSVRTTESSPFGTKGRSSRTGKRVDWYMRGLPGDSPHPSGPNEMNVSSGMAPQASSQGGAGSSHIQQPSI